MNFGELKARLRVSVKNPSEEDKPESLMGEYINDGYRDVFSRYPFHQARRICTFQTVPGEAKYQLPRDVSAVLSVSNRSVPGRRGKLFKSDDDHVIDRPWTGFNACPKQYVRYRNYLHLLPTPDQVYTIAVYFKQIAVLLQLDTDVPALPADWHIGIVWRARWYYFVEAGDSQQATIADNNFKLWVLDKPTEIEEETVDQDQGIGRPELQTRLLGGGLPRDGDFFEDGNW
jgi:hypothetical protein